MYRAISRQIKIKKTTTIATVIKTVARTVWCILSYSDTFARIGWYVLCHSDIFWMWTIRVFVIVPLHVLMSNIPQGIPIYRNITLITTVTFNNVIWISEWCWLVKRIFWSPNIGKLSSTKLSFMLPAPLLFIYYWIALPSGHFLFSRNVDIASKIRSLKVSLTLSRPLAIMFSSPVALWIVSVCERKTNKKEYP